MQCPTCGYVLPPLDTHCLRCAITKKSQRKPLASPAPRASRKKSLNRAGLCIVFGPTLGLMAIQVILMCFNH